MEVVPVSQSKYCHVVCFNICKYTAERLKKKMLIANILSCRLNFFFLVFILWPMPRFKEQDG